MGRHITQHAAVVSTCSMRLAGLVTLGASWRLGHSCAPMAGSSAAWTQSMGNSGVGDPGRNGGALAGEGARLPVHAQLAHHLRIEHVDLALQ